MRLLAQAGDIWGELTPPSGSDVIKDNPVSGLGRFITFGIKFFILIAAGALLIYLFWGAFEYITSGGDKEKISKSVNKMTSAVIGIIILFAVIAIYGYIVGDMLGIIYRDPTTGQWIINLPRLE